MAQTDAGAPTTGGSIDGGMFTIGFAVGLLVGKLVLRSTTLALAFATGLGLALGMSSEGPVRLSETRGPNGR